MKRSFRFKEGNVRGISLVLILLILLSFMGWAIDSYLNDKPIRMEVQKKGGEYEEIYVDPRSPEAFILYLLPLLVIILGAIFVHYGELFRVDVTDQEIIIVRRKGEIQIPLREIKDVRILNKRPFGIHIIRGTNYYYLFGIGSTWIYSKRLWPKEGVLIETRKGKRYLLDLEDNLSFIRYLKSTSYVATNEPQNFINNSVHKYS